MDRGKQLEFIVGIFGFLQLSMQDVGLLDKKGRPVKKKKPLPSERDAIFIYDWVAGHLKNLPIEHLRPKARVMDEAVTKLLNDHTVVNNFLLGLLLLRAMVDDGSKSTQILIGSKINRLVDVVDDAISDEEFSADIKRTTARTADNLYRQFTGRLQLSDEVREARFKRIIK